VNFDSHFAKHVLHRRPHVTSDDDLDRVRFEETGNTCVVSSLGSGIVEMTPADVELFPGIDCVSRHFRDRDTIGAAPTRIHKTILGNRDAEYSGAVRYGLRHLLVA
jgi:hypothetical protein